MNIHFTIQQLYVFADSEDKLNILEDWLVGDGQKYKRIPANPGEKGRLEIACPTAKLASKIHRKIETISV